MLPEMLSINVSVSTTMATVLECVSMTNAAKDVQYKRLW